jgi:DNA-binding LytR/AlgR family response regulator
MPATKICIVEDEMLIAMDIANSLKSIGYDVTKIASNYTTAIEVIEAEKPDMVLLDIQLDGYKDGIDLAWKIKKDYDIPFIFLTANSDAATLERVKPVNAQAYLVKPFRTVDLHTSIEICLHNYVQAKSGKEMEANDNYLIKDSLFIKQGQYLHKVMVSDILYLEADNVYLKIHVANTKYMVRSNLPDYLTLINQKTFCRVHKGFAVNIQHIQMINTDYLVINNVKIPIGRAYRNQLLSYLKIG